MNSPPVIRRASEADVHGLVALMSDFYAKSEFPLPVESATRAFATQLDARRIRRQPTCIPCPTARFTRPRDRVLLDAATPHDVPRSPSTYRPQPMDAENVQIVMFPETRVAAIEHRGSPSLEYETAKKLIAWRHRNHIDRDRHRSYGVHYTDPYTTPPADHHVDFCISFDDDVAPNPEGVVRKVIPASRCALARHLGSRAHNSAAEFLYREWLPQSGETPGDFPIFFHYVNVGPDVHERDMITDVYLPLKG